MITIPAEIKTQLSRGEKLLWSGQPRQGLLLRSADVIMIPFSLLWGGFAIFWELGAIRTGDPFFMLWGIPFVAIGLYMIAGRFLVDARQRAKTFYGVSNERILIVSGMLKQKVDSLNLRTLTNLSLSEEKDSEGTISFGGSTAHASMFRGSGWPGMQQHQAPSFESIKDAKSVFETIREAQRAAA